MLRKAATVRYLSYMFGTLFTIINLFLIVTYLDIFQFAVWGVANSLIYVFSQFGQLTYVQYIEKYFPTLSKEKMDYYLYKFIKTISSLTIVWLLVLFVLDYFGYFNKYNAENLYILFLIVSLLTTVESIIEISSKYLLALKETKKLDVYELFIFKFLRLIIFFLLLINNFSIYYLLLTNLIIRSVFLVAVLNHNRVGIVHIIKSVFKSKIFDDNFKQLSYTSIAFIIKSMQVTFLNVIFLILTLFSENETIAKYSLGILIINNMKPIFASLSSLLLPIISLNIKEKKDNSELLKLVIMVNSVIISVLVMISLLVTEYQFIISFFLNDFDESIYTIIVLAVYVSAILMFYYPEFINLLFSNYERQLFYFMLLNYSLCLGGYYLFSKKYELNILLFYLLFDLLNLIFTKYLHRKISSTRFFRQIGITFWLVTGFVFFTAIDFDFNLSFSFIFFLVFLIYDLNKLKKNLKSYDLLKEVDEKS